VLAALARLAIRRPLTVISAWLLLLVIGFGVGTGVFARLDDTINTVPGSESERADQLLDRLHPDGDSFTAIIADADIDDPALRAEIGRAVAEVRAVPGIADAADPYAAAAPGLAAEDRRAVLIPVTLAGGLDDAELERAMDAAAERLRAIEAAAPPGAEIRVSGGELLANEMGEQGQEDVARAELISLPVVLVLLLLVFGGLRAAGLPVVVAVCGIAGAFLALYGFSQVTDISVYAVQVTSMLGLGLAVDYALLMVMRFREERRHHPDLAEAVTATVAGAGRTVLFSGLTVAVSLAGLLVFPSPFLRSMGLAATAVVLVDMAAAITLLPALLARFGGRIRPAARPADSEGRLFARLARLAAARPVAVAACSVPVLLVLALPALDTRIALGDSRSLPADSEARQLDEAIAAHYPAGTGNEPVSVLLRPGADPALAESIRSLPGVVGHETIPLPDGHTLLRVTAAGPVDGETATTLVGEIRELREIRADGEEAMVTGPAARLADFRDMMASHAPWAVATVLLAILALLFAFTGSVLLPLRTIATTLLSLAAALGVVVWVFQDGNLTGLLNAEELDAVNITAPPLILAIAFGLAMDYELFILARMRESWLRDGDAHEAVITGLRSSGRVVTCAALLLAIVFGAFMTGGFSPVIQIGLGLTLAVLIDATVVRMLLVPATMALLGRHAWWSPAPLRRLHRRYGLREPAAGKTETEAEAGAGPGPVPAEV
jgi:RND superfamily putative drug exporter